jgi:hypothetical protein
MNIEKRLMQYYRRWNIEFPYEEQFSKFKNRIITAVDELMGKFLVNNSNLDKKISEVMKLHKADEPKVKKAQVRPNLLASLPPSLDDIIGGVSVTDKGFGDTYVYREIKSTKTPQELALVLQSLFWILEDHEQGIDFSSQLSKRIRIVAELSPSVSFNIVNKGGKVILYPHGDEFLDKEIVDYVISELQNYPKAAKYFEQALKIYQSGDTSQYRTLLDHLRFALEQLLKKVLRNEKSLENQKEVLLPWLRQKKLHTHVVSMYETLLFGRYAPYHNDAVKHNEKFSLDEVEFMIYLTGSFMRLIIQLENGNSTPDA